jgi:golgin subfamily A member 4
MHYSSLQEAQSSLSMKDKELAEATESLKELGSDLETSKKRIKEIEAELDSSADMLRKLEELKDERSLHAAQEAKRPSELDKMLELAQSNMKEMEKHISSLQEEVKGHQDKATSHYYILANSKPIQTTLCEQTETGHNSNSIVYYKRLF